MAGKTLLLVFAMMTTELLPGAEGPVAEISNGEIRARIHLPDANAGFYRGTRFDGSGIIYSLQYKGHEYYGPWFDRIEPPVHDFVYRGAEIVAGAASAITGPVDEFAPSGWEQAQPGGVFLKIGVGALRRPDAAPYDSYRLYDAASRGTWTVRTARDSVEFTHTLADASTGYGYVYRKTVRLEPGKPEMVLEHRLKNTGRRAIETSVYNHNFLTLDRQAPGAGLTITFPFAIRAGQPPDARLAAIRGNQVAYLRTLEGQDRVAMPVEGFGTSVRDHDIRIENTRLGAGVRIAGDRPLARVYLWSIRSVVSVEPFVAVAAAPGEEFTWTTRYTYYTVTGAPR
jgi:hypothetical protein